MLNILSLKEVKRFRMLSSLILVLFLVSNASFAQEIGRTERIISPEFTTDNAIYFRIKAPQAKSVQLSGNWMQIVPNGDQGMTRKLTDLTQGEDGVWSVKVEGLEPELYGYTFLVDGVSTLDPSNFKIARDGTFRTESLLEVEGGQASLYYPKTGPKGSTHHIWYDSPTLNLTRRMIVYTPPGYEKSTERYPVLYLLHGGGGDEEAWSTLGVAPTILDNLITIGKAESMIVVMTNGNPTQAAAFTVSPKIDVSNSSVGGMANKMFEKKFSQ